MNFSQCYYTSTGGWNAVGSPDLPANAKTAFAAAQAANAPTNKHYLDADNKPLHMIELSGDTKYLFMTSCQYGTLDQRGRPNMFAHGYCAEWTKAMIEDPAEICFIDQSSFALTKEQISFESQPKISPIHGFANAMQAAGFSWNHFAMLTLAVYAVAERKDESSLYLATELDGMRLHALIYCIYMSMPYSLRTKLSFATAAVPGAKAKTVIFCKPGKAPAGALYFDLSTGENNVVTQDWMKKNKKNQFMRYFGSCGGNDSAQQYFKQLDQRLQQLGKPGSASYKLLYLADIVMMMDQNAALPADDHSLVYAMLTAPVPNVDYLDGYLAVLLDRLLEANVEFNDELNDLIWQRLRATGNQKMMESRMRFRRRELLKMSDEKAADELLDMKQHAGDGALQKREFDEAQMYLFQSPQGREIFGYAVRKDYLQQDNKNYTALADVYSDCKQLECNPQLTKDFVLQQAYELFCHDINSKPALTAFEAYTEFLKKRFAPETVAEYQLKGKKRYWDLFDLSAFDTAKATEYAGMITEHPNCQKAKDYAHVYNKQQSATADDAARLYLKLLQSSDLMEKERRFLFEQCKTLCMSRYEMQLSDSSALLRLASYAKRQSGRSIVTELAELRMTDDVYTWQRVLQSAPCFMDEGVLSDAYVEKFIQTVQTDVQNTASEKEKKLADGILSAYQSILAEKKQLEKQALKAQKEEMRQQRKEQASSAFGKLGSLIGRKNETAQTAVQIESENTDPYQDIPRQKDLYTADDGQYHSYTQQNAASAWEVSNGEAETDVIYSGRDLSQMSSAPSISGESYEQNAAEPKKKKMSDLFGKWKK